MGLATWWRVRRMKTPVLGSLKVTACAQPDTARSSASYGALVMGVVRGPGITPRAVEFSTTVPSARCPRSGQHIPVVVDRADPRRIAVQWDKVPRRDVLGAARRANQQAASTARRKRGTSR
ncbi:hypothetical protein [Streptomyces sp. SPB074]|uniref:hypothetical protein n=1 Tax=Streptomyces sp. (strain SPB074) TaxID=465543 RepID=UPI00017F1ABB|nr:hypothetical protein [Streptomyces sp. SPB074]EDY42304.1 hypothetical protein SSBG_00052 [Streptomyces sp. SPB074]